jgi:hypothetical protein
LECITRGCWGTTVYGTDDVRADGGFMDEKKSDALLQNVKLFGKCITDRCSRTHYGVNKSIIRFITKNKARSGETSYLVFHRVRKFLVEAVLTPSSTRLKKPFV